MNKGLKAKFHFQDSFSMQLSKSPDLVLLLSSLHVFFLDDLSRTLFVMPTLDMICLSADRHSFTRCMIYLLFSIWPSSCGVLNSSSYSWEGYDGPLFPSCLAHPQHTGSKTFFRWFWTVGLNKIFTKICTQEWAMLTGMFMTSSDRLDYLKSSASL